MLMPRKKSIRITSGKKVSTEYTLTLGNYKVVDTYVGSQPLTYTQGSHQIILALEKAMEGSGKTLFFKVKVLDIQCP
jgi:FKBP-type peptidyl-prolyl cis-trans isomerase 2